MWHSRRIRTFAIALRRSCLAVAVLASAQSALAAQRPVRSLLEYRQEGVVIQQWDISCGAAALATVLTYGHRFPVSEEEVARGMLKRTDPLHVRYRGGF